MNRASFALIVKSLGLRLRPSPRDEVLTVPDTVSQGQVYRLPSGAFALVIGVGVSDIACLYVPDNGEHERVDMRRDFFMSRATRAPDMDPDLDADDMEAGRAGETVSRFDS